MKVPFPRTAGGLSLALVVLLLGQAAWAKREEPLQPDPPSPERVREIASWLPEQPQGMGRPITDRAAWEAVVAAHPEAKKLIRQAAEYAEKPLPPAPDNLFLDYSRNGNREHWQKAEYPRRERVKLFTLAECLENRGRFIAPLEQAIASLCAERTWVLSAHDGKLLNFSGQAHDIDLGDSMVGLDLATTDWLLGDRLSPATRRLIRQNLEVRLFQPYHAAATGTSPRFWWMHGINNWNAVCLNGVTASAMAIVASRPERAWYAAVAERNVKYYLHGFTPDGYCVEGLGYWNYGFGNYALLAETLRQATGGRIDWLAEPAAAEPALFGARTEIIHGIYPTVADSHPGGEPSADLMYYLKRRIGWEQPGWDTLKLDGTLTENVTLAFLPANLPRVPTPASLDGLAWRTCFPQGGVFLLRPGPAAAKPFAACVKGGNNGVSHGHNDVGSFSVISGHTMVVCDPGGEVYTSRTFSSHRYDSDVLNSFGHALPVVAGQLQRTGEEARAILLATNYSAAADSLTFDLHPAYEVPDLQKLVRTFTYTRGTAPSLTVRDEADFTRPESYETALVTWGEIHPIAPGEWELRDGPDAVRVKVETGGEPFHLTTKTIHENVGEHTLPVHVGFVLDHKVANARVTLHITPAP